MIDPEAFNVYRRYASRPLVVRSDFNHVLTSLEVYELRFMGLPPHEDSYLVRGFVQDRYKQMRGTMNGYEQSYFIQGLAHCLDMLDMQLAQAPHDARSTIVDLVYMLPERDPYNDEPKHIWISTDCDLLRMPSVLKSHGLEEQILHPWKYGQLPPILTNTPKALK